MDELRGRRVLVTGADGFVGRHLVPALSRSGAIVTATGRGPSAHAAPVAGCRWFATGAIGASTDWSEALDGVDAVVHCAARVHDVSADPDDDARYREINIEATGALAAQAAARGVRRFVFLSSIKVNGERTSAKPFSAGDAPAPADAYARSKLGAERVLKAVAAESGLEIVVLRPPLVYGPGVRANFAQLFNWVARGRPLPLAGVDNRRSLINVWNLVDVIELALVHPACAGRVWLVSDGEDLSTPELVRRIAAACRVPARLFALPAPLLRAAATLAGRAAALARLTESLQVDIGPAREQLGWTPPVSIDAALARIVAA